MSAPERPTLVNRKAIFALAAAIRMSQAAAITAPAPATVPFSAPTIGRRQAIIDRMSAPVARVNSSSPRASRLEELADDRLDVAARAEGAAGAGEQDRAHSAARCRARRKSA